MKPLDGRHQALLNVFFYQADEHDRLGMRRAMLEAALEVHDQYLKRSLGKITVSEATRAEVLAATKLNNEQLISLICS